MKLSFLKAKNKFLLSSALIVSLGLSSILSAQASCLPIYHSQIEVVSANTAAVSGPLGFCTLVGATVFLPVGAVLAVATAGSAAIGRSEFKKYARAKRLIQGAYAYLNEDLPQGGSTKITQGQSKSKGQIQSGNEGGEDLLSYKQQNPQNLINTLEEQKRKFKKYFENKKIAQKTGLTLEEFAKVIVKADKKDLFCQNPVNNPLFKYEDIINLVYNGQLQLQLDIPLTDKQEEVIQEKHEKKKKKNAKSGKYIRI